MAPKTRSLQKFGTKVDCYHILSPAFSLDGEFVHCITKCYVSNYTTDP